MADIFISYSSKDRHKVRKLADLFLTQGWSVWWDPRIPPGKTYTEVIEHELTASRSVVVVWSTMSVSSQWVQNEAREGAQRRVLVPIRLDAVKIPLEFSHLQTADLSGWNGGDPHVELAEVFARLKELAPLNTDGHIAPSQPVSAEDNHRQGRPERILPSGYLRSLLGKFGFSSRLRQREQGGKKAHLSARRWALTGAVVATVAIFALSIILGRSRRLCDANVDDMLGEYTASAKTCRAAGYRPVSMAMYGPANARRFATIWQQGGKPDWRAETELTLGEYSTLLNKLVSEGYRPTLVSVVDDGIMPPRAAAVFEKDPSAWRASHDLSWDTFENLNKERQQQGMILRWVSIYGQTAAPQVAALWSSNQAGEVWKTTGFLTQGEYTKAFEAYKKEDFSPAFVTVGCWRKEFRYFGVFVQHQKEAVWGFHNWEAADFGQFLNEKKSQGYVPRVVQACQTESSTRFSGVLVRK